MSKLSPSLPPAFTQNKNEFIAKLKDSISAQRPVPGTLVSSYSQRSDDQDHLFEVYECALEKNKEAQQLHRNLQMMAPWFIEGADAIDVSDPRWVVFVIFERLSDLSALLPVGFVTLFKFTNPLGRKAADSVATQTHRICQALIFPTHQRQRK